MKKRLLSLISAMALCFTAMPSYAVAEDTNDDIYEYELMLSCSETHFYDDDDTLTYFYVDTDYEGETITLVDADSLTEYTMVDDGKFSISGDDLQNDGVYTTKIELDTTMTSFSKEYHFYAVTGDGSNSSNTVTIKITKKITDAQIKEMGAVDEAISTLQSTKNYKSASNNERITMLYELLSELAENGTEQYPYSLIQKDSIKLSDDKKTYFFNYYFGLASGTMIAVSINEDIMTVSVVDYDTGELILTDTDQEWAITLQAGFSVEYALIDGTFTWGTEWVDLDDWSYGSLNPCEIDISSYGTGFGIEGFQVVNMYIPDGYFLPEDYLEMNYKESDEYHTDFPSDITVKLKKTTMGDVNDDGAFNVSDVVLLQKWLLAVPDMHLANWRAADFCKDERVDVFDLCLMKRALIYGRIALSTIDLKTQFPEYYGLSTTKGLEVYLWQETESSYKCGLLMGTNRNKTDEEIIDLTHNGATVEQMKEILSSYNIDKNMITIIPVQISETSYEIIESDLASAEEMFWGNSSDEPDPQQDFSMIKQLSADDIDNVVLSAYPPEKSVNLTKDQINELLILLNAVTLYEEDNSYNEYAGHWVQFDITLNNGEEISLAVFNPFFIINRNGYRAEYEPCQALNVFANSIIAE